VRAELLYRHPTGFYAGPNVEWTPTSYYVDNANTTTADPYALLNFKLGYDAGDGVSAYLEARNLFDTRYIASASIAEVANATSALFEPGSGRAVYGGVRLRM
jgi:iron complex outermembrane receptor protein